jgi:hypothetical protein
MGYQYFGIYCTHSKFVTLENISRCFLPVEPRSGQAQPTAPESRKEGNPRHPAVPESRKEGSLRHPAVPESGQEGNLWHPAVPESGQEGNLWHPAVPESGQSSDPPKATEHEDSVASAKSFVRQRSGSTSMVSVKRKRFEVAASALAAPLTAVDKRGGRDRAASFGGGQVARLRWGAFRGFSYLSTCIFHTCSCRMYRSRCLTRTVDNFVFLKVLTNEKRGGLTVVSFDRARCKLFSQKK